MADLLRALVNSPFDWFPSNIPCGKDKMPLDPAFVPRKPDQIKVSLKVEVTPGKEKSVGFYVTPASGESVEDFLAHTWDQYKKSSNAMLPSELREHGPTHFRLFPLALGITATTIWTKVLEENGIKAIDEEGTNDNSYTNFLFCVSLFVEEMAGVKYIGDAIIRWLRHAKKPMLMAPDAAFRRRSTILSYLDGGLLRSKLARPTAYELAEAVFLAFPKSYQERYAETHDELEDDLAPLRSAFSQYHAVDVRNGVITKLRKEREDRKRPPERSERRSGKKGRRSNAGKGYDRDRRDREGSDRRDRGYDRRDNRDRYRNDDRDRNRDRNNRGGRGGGPPRSGFKPPSNKGKPYKGEEAHHVDDGSASSRSRSASRERDNRSRSRSRSRSNDDRDFEEEEEGYMMSLSNRDIRDPQLPESLEYSDDENSRHRKYFDSKKPRRGLSSFFTRSRSEPR